MNEKYSGKVKWFNTNKGFGFIQTEDGQEVFVHYTDIESAGFKNLSEGESVLFKITDNGKGLRAVEVEKSE
jgi:CspA family cold shock protein